jgi:hypothetical protein
VKKYVLAGAGVAAVLTVLAVLGALLQWWWLVVAAAMILLSLVLLVGLDADRRVRALRAFIHQEISRVAGPAPDRVAPPVADADVVGAVRVLQAQYTGRLDRMQESIDRATALPGAQGPDSGGPTRPSDET